MPRTKSDWATWHVINRGCRRLALFHDQADFSRFESILKYSLGETECTLGTYTLMSNHYHLLPSGGSKDLTECMRRVDTMYSRYHNEKYELTGTTFEGRYEAFLQKSPYLIQCKAAYILLNPVAAGIVQSPELYRWSGWEPLLTGESSRVPLLPDPILESLDPDPAVARSKFRAFLLSRELKPEHGVAPTWKEVARQQFECLLEPAKIRASRVGLPSEAVASYWASKIGIPPRFIASALGQTDSIKIRRAIYEVGERLKRKPRLRNWLRLP